MISEGTQGQSEREMKEEGYSSNSYFQHTLVGGSEFAIEP